MANYNLVAAGVLALASCGPLSALSKTADMHVGELEECCTEALRQGQGVSECDLAFRAHDRFLWDWEMAYQTGIAKHHQEAAISLAEFVQLKEEACELVKAL